MNYANRPHLTRETLELIDRVIDRAYAMGIGDLGGDTRFDHFMDMECAARHFDSALDLNAMLGFDDFSFAHDFIGIRNHTDRPNCAFSGLFLPRCVHGES